MPKIAKQDISDQSLHFLHSKVDAVVHQMNHMGLPNASSKEAGTSSKPQPLNKAAIVYYCECCGHKGHDASSCQVYSEEVAPEGNIKEFDYVHGFPTKLPTQPM